MDTSDLKEFNDLMAQVFEYYDKPVSTGSAEMYFNGLARFSFDQVKFALNKHIQTPGSGRFSPKVADVVAIIEGDTLKADEIIAAARLKKTPLGIYAWVHIGHWALANGDPFYLKQRAEEIIQMLPEIKHKFLSGGYDPHHLAIMEKYGVSHFSPLYEGMPPASQAARKAITSTLNAVRSTDRYLISSGKINSDDVYSEDARPRLLAVSNGAN